MSRFAFCAPLALAAFIAGCVPVNQDDRRRDAATAVRDGSAAADVRESTPDSSAPNTPDSSAPPTTCREIRVCVFECGENAACVARCVSSAPAVARQAFEEAQMCSVEVCPAQDIECRCDQECHGGGVCYQLVDECDEAISDPFCSGPCH